MDDGGPTFFVGVWRLANRGRVATAGGLTSPARGFLHGEPAMFDLFTSLGSKPAAEELCTHCCRRLGTHGAFYVNRARTCRDCFLEASLADNMPAEPGIKPRTLVGFVCGGLLAWSAIWLVGWLLIG